MTPGATASVTFQAQLTIPIEVPGKLRLPAGDPGIFVERKDGGFTVRVKKGNWMDLCGWFNCGWHKWTAHPATLEEMDRADCQAFGAARRPWCMNPLVSIDPTPPRAQSDPSAGRRWTLENQPSAEQIEIAPRMGSRLRGPFLRSAIEGLVKEAKRPTQKDPDRRHRRLAQRAAELGERTTETEVCRNGLVRSSPTLREPLRPAGGRSRWARLEAG